MSKSLLMLACAPLLLGGCLAGAISSERLGRVQRLSRFQSKCPTLRLVSSSRSQYRFSGCGRSYVYRCHERRRNPFRKVSDAEAIEFLFTAGLDPNAPCTLADVYRDGSPGPRPRRVAHGADQAGPHEPPPATPAPPQAQTWPAPEGVDDPGVIEIGAETPKAQPRAKLPRLPDSSELKRVMSAVQPRVRRCAGAAGRVTVDLRVAASGAVESARVKAALPSPAKRCVEAELKKAKVAPFASGPVTLAYLFDLR